MRNTGRNILFLLILIGLLGCDSQNAWDCIQAEGTIIQEEVDVEGFNKIQVWERVKLIVSHGNTQKVVVETGENLINEVQLRVEDSILFLSDRNSCNHVRDYGITKIYVTAPNLIEIRNSSGQTVESRGVLEYFQLALVSEDPENLDVYHFDGDFDMDVKIARLKVRANGLSKFYLRGTAGFANFQLYDGDARIEAGALQAKSVYVFHRSTNKMIINPLESVFGEIRGLGDVIAKNRPPIVEVEEYYSGRLIFE